MSYEREEKELDAMLAAARAHTNEPLPRLVEQRVLARLRPEMTAPPAHAWRAKIRWSLALVAGAAVAAIAVVILRPATPAVQLAATQGEVHADAPLETLTTRSSSRALVTLPKARLTALADTSLTIAEATPASVRLVLDHGAAVADVDPASQPRSFEISLPHALVRITGTLFYVSALADKSQIAVERGHVRVTAAMGELTVDGGEVVEIHEDGHVMRRALALSERTSLIAALDAQRWTSPSIEALSTGVVIAEAVEPAPPLTPQPMPPEPKEPSAPPPRHHHADTKKNDTPFAEVNTLLDKHACAAARAKIETATGDDASRPWYAIAQCFHAAHDLENAVRVYREVVERFPKAVVSENAEYEVARLSREIGHGQEAESAFTDYLARYPKGALAQEAFFWRCHLAASNGHTDDAIGCLRNFRERFPKSARAVETLFSEATLLRTAKKDCAAALPVYNAYLASDGAHREQALSWRDWCESHTP